MTFEIYEYQPSEDGKLEKVVYETLEELEPSDAETPFEYLRRYILNKRISLEKVSNDIIDAWYENMYSYNILMERIIKELRLRGLDEHDPSNFWGLNHPIVKRMVGYLSEVYLMTYGNTEEFMKTLIMKAAPEEIKAEFASKTREDFYSWLQYLTNKDAARPVRPIIPEDVYSKYDRDEAKQIIVAIRDKFVRNNEDSVADALKLCSFLAGAIKRIYNVLPQESKNQLSPVDRNILDYGFAVQSELQTRCDSELAEEGLSVIKKLLTREDSINEIILLVYSHLKA